MQYDWLHDYCMAKSGTEFDHQPDWNWDRYMLFGKLYAALCYSDETGEPLYLTVKTEPMEGDFLRRQYPDILPGYYMNHVHWNSIRYGGAVPDELAKALVDKSYGLIYSKLTKKQKRDVSL